MPLGADILSVVAKPRPKSEGGNRPRPGISIQAYIDPELRAAMDEYITAYNSSHDHKASVTSTIEAALKKYLTEEGHWPRRKPKPA